MIIDPSFSVPSTRPTNAPFIVIEGINGGGKSTLITGLIEWLSARGVPHLRSREPGGTPLGVTLRSLLLSSPEPIVPLSELFLFLADRAHHVATVIEPALRDGITVICDRFFYSTIAFQGYGRGLDCPRLLEMNRLATNDLRPDLVILLDLPVEDALRRAQHRNSADGAERDSFEAEELAFHERVRDGFLALAKELPEPFLILDARQEPEILLKQASQAISSLLRCD